MTFETEELKVVIFKCPKCGTESNAIDINIRENKYWFRLMKCGCEMTQLEYDAWMKDRRKP